jgi:hypothetical protein
VPSWPSINRTLRPFSILAAARMPQQKILEDEFPLARPQRTAASTARYLTIVGFWASLNLDDVVERAAMPAFKKLGLLADAMCAALLLIAMARPRGAVMNTDDTSSVDLGQSDFGRDQSRELSQCRGPFLSNVTRAIGEMAGGSSMPPQGLHSQDIPGPHSQASARWLVPRQGRSDGFRRPSRCCRKLSTP